MQDISQIKTAKGAIPCKGAAFVNQDSDNFNDNLIEFDAYSPLELTEIKRVQGDNDATPRSTKAEANAVSKENRHASLINLAACIRPNDEGPGYKPIPENILAFAKQSGPLFGESTHESIRAWLYAASTALIAVKLQQFINNDNEIARAIANSILQKNAVSVTNLDTHFFVYQTSFTAANEYAAIFSQKPTIKRIETQTGFYYAFINSAPYDNQPDSPLYVSIYVFAFENEISNTDFVVLRHVIENVSQTDLDDEVIQDFRSSISLEDADNSPTEMQKFSENTPINFTEEKLNSNDKTAVRTLIQAICAPHLFHAHVDVFQLSDDTGFLVFDNYLSWLR